MPRRHLLSLVACGSLAAAAPASGAIVFFSTPSGNIGCVGDTVERYVRCDIRSRSWSPPPRPRTCEFDWAQGIALTARGKAHFVCAGDTALTRERPLAYGRTRRIGPITCTSRTTGLTCVNAAGRSFALSRERYSLR